MNIMDDYESLSPDEFIEKYDELDYYIIKDKLEVKQ